MRRRRPGLLSPLGQVAIGALIVAIVLALVVSGVGRRWLAGVPW